MQPNTSTESCGRQSLASIYINTMYIYSLNHEYVATYGHIYQYIQHLYTQMVCKITSQCIYCEEADACYTKLTKLWCNNTQLLCKGL